MTGRTQKALTHAAVLSGSGPPLLAASLLLTRQPRGAAGKWVLALPLPAAPHIPADQGAGQARAWDALRTCWSWVSLP